MNHLNSTKNPELTSAVCPRELVTFWIELRLVMKNRFLSK